MALFEYFQLFTSNFYYFRLTRVSLDNVRNGFLSAYYRYDKRLYQQKIFFVINKKSTKD